LHADLNSFCSSIEFQGLTLTNPWSSTACQQRCANILQQLASAAEAAEQSTELQAPALKQQQQQGCWQQLLSLLLPQLLDGLRDTLMAQHRHNRAQDRGELGEGCFVFSSERATA
jgi:hypothetical protein